MKKLFFLLLLGHGLTFVLFGQNANTVNIGHIDSLDSKILQEKRKVWVYVPDNLEGDIYAKTAYPVVYLLDGDAHFFSVVGMIRQLSSINGNSICPKMIVVGILNTNRTRDLTPNPGDPNHFYVSASGLNVEDSGKGAQFLSFIEKELMPHMESNYRTTPYRMFIGHSFGGLTVLNTLIHRPDLFNAYVSIDPSMWWGKQQLLKDTKQTNMGMDKSYANKKLFLAIANTVGKSVDTLLVQQDTSLETEHLRTILETHHHLKNQKGNFDYQGKYYPDDDHGSVPLIAEYDALRFFFKNYRLDIDRAALFDADYDAFTKIIEHYQQLSKDFGYDLKPPEELINNYGYQYLGQKQFEKSKQFFEFNTTHYPDSFNAFDSLGDYYVAVGDKQKAIDSFKKSIALNKDSYSKTKLEELEKE